MFYWFTKYFFWLLLRCLSRWRVTGLEYFPDEGPVVVVANHVSYWDPIVLGVAAPRRVWFLAKEELFHTPGIRWVVRWWQAIPLRRAQSDLVAMRAALKVLQRGEVVGVFPEGGRHHSAGVGNFEGGAFLLAVRGKATVVPAFIDGTKGLLTRRWFRTLRISFGAPISCEEYNRRRGGKGSLDELARVVRQAVAELHDEVRSS